MKILEVWIDVPETKGQYQVSNHGRIRLMHRKSKHRRRGDKDVPPEYVGEERLLFCEFETKRLGWLVRDLQTERKWRFVPRDEMMSLLSSNGIPVCVDTSHDAEAVAQMEDANEKHLADTESSPC